MFELMEKSRNKKGFTLMEMLIVVAIIAILVAIIIPVFANQLEKARKAADAANIRAAYAMAQSCTLLEQSPNGASPSGTYYLQKDGDFRKGSSGVAATDYKTQGSGTKDDCPVFGAWAKDKFIYIIYSSASSEWAVHVGS